MSSLNSITISSLTNDEAYTFHKAISELAATIQSDPLASYTQKYSESFDALKTAIDKTAGSTAASNAKDADAARDKAWSGCNAYIKAVAEYCPDDTLREMATPIASLFEKYGNPTKLSYAKETSVLDNLIESVEALGEDTIAAANFSDWFENLKSKHSAYEEAAKTSVDSAAVKVVGAVKDARNACDTAYSELGKMIAALCLVVGEDAFADFISKANVIIDKQKAVIKARQTANAKAKSSTSDETSEVSK